MATLTITPMEATGATLGVLVTATLTDADGVEVSGMLTADPGVIVRPTAERITAVPHTLDLTPNADISPANTYWTVEVAGNSFLITKTSASETLVECLAVDPVDLALPVMVQEVSAEVTTQVDALAATLPDLADSPAGTVPVPVGTTVLVVESGAIRQTDATEFGGTVDLVSNVATASILGRVTGGSGDSEELTGTQAWSILDDASPTTAMTWTASLTISAADGFSVGSGTAANGDVHLGAGALGSAASFFANTADTQAAAVLGSALGLRLGPGGSTVADWTLTRTGTAAATITGAVTVGNGTANQGSSVVGSSAFGAAVSFFANTADGQAAAVLGSALGLRLGPGGSTVADWSIVYTSTAVATMTGALRTATAPSNPNDLTNKTYVDAQVDDLSGVTNAATARANLGLGTAATTAATDYVAALSRAGRLWPPSPPLSRTWKLAVPSATTSVNSLGMGSAAGTIGTVTTPVVSTGGTFTQAVCAASANSGADLRFTANAWYRGATSDLFGGFHFHSRVRFPDASYDNTGASTGCYLNVGLASVSPISVRRLASVHGAVFNREHENGRNTDTNWQFVVNGGGATATTVDTGIPFTIANTYEMWITCTAGATSIGWEIRDLTADTSASGSVSTDLPGASTAVYPAVHLRTMDAVARTIQVARLYTESDKG